MEQNYEHIPQEKFRFAQLDADLHDKKLQTKSRGYFADAFLRFKKNKSSVVAAIIIACLVLFAIVSPILSPYTIKDKDTVYTNRPPYIPAIAKWNIGLFDGAVTHDSQNEIAMEYWRGIAEETGMDPLIRIVSTQTKKVVYRGQEVEDITYKIKTNKYFETGIVYRTLSYEAFEKLQQFQNETGIQVIYPYVEPKDIGGITDNPNLWYQVSDSKGTPVLDADGNFIPVYSTNASLEGAPYNSLRIEGDPGNYIYSVRKSGSVTCRICYYNYYRYLRGTEPS